MAVSGPSAARPAGALPRPVATLLARLCVRAPRRPSLPAELRGRFWFLAPALLYSQAIRSYLVAEGVIARTARRPRGESPGLLADLLWL